MYVDYLYDTRILNIDDKKSLLGCVMQDPCPQNPYQCMDDALGFFMAYPSFARLGNWNNLPIFENEPNSTDDIATHLEKFKEYMRNSHGDIIAYAVTADDLEFNSETELYGETQPKFYLRLEDGVKPSSAHGKDAVGFIFAKESEIYEQFGVETITQDILEKVHNKLLEELKLWSLYFSGEVYEYYIFSDSYEVINKTDTDELVERIFEEAQNPVKCACCFYDPFDAYYAMVERMGKIKEESCK